MHNVPPSSPTTHSRQFEPTIIFKCVHYQTRLYQGGISISKMSPKKLLRQPLLYNFLGKQIIVFKAPRDKAKVFLARSSNLISSVHCTALQWCKLISSLFFSLELGYKEIEGGGVALLS